MIKTYLYLISFISYYYSVRCDQPYLPTQITFHAKTYTDQRIYAIDEINQRAYQSIISNSVLDQTVYAMKNFPYAAPDSPQSKYYVQLLIDFLTNTCQYATYWKNHKQNFNNFPAYWWTNESTFKIKNYLNFDYPMKFSNDSFDGNDYWSTEKMCLLDTGALVSCDSIYFKKNTEIPLQSDHIIREAMHNSPTRTIYKEVSTGKPDETFFDLIPKNWYTDCEDVTLGVDYYPSAVVEVQLNKSVEVQVSLTAPPHRVDGNDTVRIQWKLMNCDSCVTWTPKELFFNIENFEKRQKLIITRVKDSSMGMLSPIFNGGGFKNISPYLYPILFQ